MNKSRLAIVLFTLALLVGLFFLFKSVLSFIVISTVLGLIGRPVVKLLQKIKFKKFKVGNSLAAAITLILFYGLIVGFVALFVPALVQEAQAVADINPEKVLLSLQDPINQVDTMVSDLTGSEFSIEDFAKDKLTSVIDITKVSSLLNGITGFTGNVFISFFAISFITFFFLKDGATIRKNVALILPTEFRDEMDSITIKVKTQMSRYFIGLVIEMAVVFTLNACGLWIFGVKNLLIIALFAGIINIIPYIGPMIGIAFGLLITVTGNFGLEFYGEMLPILIKLVGVMLTVQLVDNIVLQPLIYSNSVNAHPLEIFLVILIAGNIGGPTGMIVAIPLYSVLRIVVKEIRDNSSFLDKLYGPNTSSDQ